MNRIIRRYALRGLYAVAGITLSVGMVSQVVAQSISQRNSTATSLNFAAIDTTDNHKANKEVMMFVRFDTPSVAEAVLSSRAAGQVPMARAAQSEHAARLSQEQILRRKQLDVFGARVLSTMRIGANGMRVMVHPDQVVNLRMLPGVISVAPVTTHTLDLTRSVGWVGAPEVWANSGDGEGVTIAVIDSGIDYLHANLGGSGDPAEYAANDFNVIEPGTFPTAKVIGGHDFAGPVYNPSSDDTALHVPSPDADPLDGNGHGSHVAGIAGGIGLDGSVAPGVAKGASLYALKVFSDTSGSTNLTADAIEWALDPNGDGDISDHVDVINMSLGSPFGDPNDGSAIAASNAADLGIIVVASAGNSGNVPYVTGSPGVGTNVISVAASSSGGDVFALSVTGAPAEGLYEAVEGVGATRIADNPVTSNLVVAEPLFGCSTDVDGNPAGLDNDIAGGIALIQRGGCSFDLKYVNAQMSGATAIVVYNDGANPTRIAPIVMGGVGNLGIPVTIPGLMIASTAGDELNAALSAGNALSASVDESIMTPTLYGDSMAGFSSRGPGHSGSGFKPDMTAPGVSVISTGAGSGTGSLTISGTSMAAPHVAGAGALLRQAFPDATPGAIKAMLMNSTADAQPDGLIGPIHPLSRQGVGVLRVNQAAALSSYASPAGVAFGRLNPSNTVNRKARVEVTNTSDRDRSFTITHVMQQQVDGLAVSAPESIRVKAGKTKKFDIKLRYDPTAVGSDDGSFSQTEADGWMILNDGVDTLRVGYFAVVDAASKVKGKGGRAEVELRNGGPANGIAEGFTLALRGDHDHGNDDGDGDSDSDKNTAAVKALGYRTGSVSGFSVVEIGINLHEAWETMSDRTFDLFLDVDQDGVDDVQLQATDFSDFDGAIGTMVTAQFDLINGGAFLDWFVGVGDYNDSSAAFIFTRLADGGLVPDSFSYRLVVSSSDGSSDTESGHIDLTNEIIPETASVAIESGDRATILTNDVAGEMLWLYQNNSAGKQSQVLRVRQ